MAKPHRGSVASRRWHESDYGFLNRWRNRQDR